jgi:soluble cytochrome b562
MSDNIENVILEHLKRIQTEQGNARERDQEILTRLSHIESGLARVTRDESANYSEIIDNRHAMDKLKERIERRLELAQ